MTTTTVGNDYEAATRLLAEWHSSREFRDFLVYSFDDPARETVRLLEISSEFPTTGEILPVTFGRSRHFPFRSTVIQVSLREWEQVEAGRLRLPEGWDLDAKRKVLLQ